MCSVFAVCDSPSTLATLMGGEFPGRRVGEMRLIGGFPRFGAPLIGCFFGPAEIDRFSQADRLHWELFYAAF